MFQRSTKSMGKRTILFFSLLLLQALILYVPAEAAQTVTGTAVDMPNAVPDKPIVQHAPVAKNERKPARAVILDENSSRGTIDVINYAGSVRKRTSDMVEVDVVLSKAEDAATLDRLANKIYYDNEGNRYQNVTINWYVGSNPQNPNMWARTYLSRTGGSFYYMNDNRN